jgi:hypothetical protein
MDKEVKLFGRNLKIVNIHHGRGNRKAYVYAELWDDHTNELLIRAELSYITMRLMVEAYNN